MQLISVTLSGNKAPCRDQPLSEPALDHLLASAARRPLLTPTQEIELGRLIRAWQDWPDGPDSAPPDVIKRGRRALDRFLTANIRLAYFCARKYEGRGVPLADLTQAALIGLRTAYLRFQPELGNKSSSYAIWYGRQACQLAVAREAGSIRLPVGVTETLRKVTRVTHRLHAENGRLPTLEEVAQEAGMGVAELRQLKADCRAVSPISLDDTNLYCHSANQRTTGRGLIDLVALSGADDPQEAVIRDNLAVTLREAIATHPELTPQQRYILQCRYLGDDKPPSLPSLASKLNLKRETVRAMERQALRILKRHLERLGIDGSALS